MSTTLDAVIARVNELSANAGLPPLEVPSAHEPAITIGGDGFQYIDGVKTSLYVGQNGDGTNAVDPNAPAPLKPAPVPASWQVGNKVRQRGITSLEPQPITAINYETGQVTAKVLDGTEGWKEVSLHWQEFRRVDGNGTVIPD